MPDTQHYSYRLLWSVEDDEYVGLCAEFPSLSWLAPTQEEALAGITELVWSTLADFRESGEPVPEPIAERDYSGRLLLRIPPELHRSLTLAAAEQGVSLNRLISARLAGGPPSARAS
ncbi:MAG: type II toxin-antitoxin system HicB family antitoxin [Candidatus Nanopelagicales bacterium]|nr:type II toxin-antitoxin system HicB family antitoxin [Candidatus Nanopelagicales bacterium]